MDPQGGSAGKGAWTLSPRIWVQFPGPTMWKKGTDSHKLSSDFRRHVMACMHQHRHTHTNKQYIIVKVLEMNRCVSIKEGKSEIAFVGNWRNIPKRDFEVQCCRSSGFIWVSLWLYWPGIGRRCGQFSKSNSFHIVLFSAIKRQYL